MITFFSDPHIGLKRSSHVTSRSQALLQERLYETAMELSLKQNAYCGGDLFDKSENPESVILQGMEVVANCSFVLTGNHDVKNRTDSVTSMSVVSKAYPERLSISPDMSKPYVASSALGVLSIPHCLTQQIFAESVNQACKMADNLPSSKAKVLVLHCNVGEGYDQGKEVDGEGSCLWLTGELQDSCVKAFDFVFVGHEHIPRTLHGGKLIVMGNTFPISFGEIADRYYYLLDLENKSVEKVLNVEAKKIYEEIPVDVIIASKGTYETDKVLVSIKGSISYSESSEFSRYVSNFWKTNPYLLMVKKGVEITKRDGELNKVCKTDVRVLSEIVNDALVELGFEEELRELRSADC